MIVVSHRGDTQSAPENSLSAFSSAISKGADGIEFDLHLTKDHQLVVHHDYMLGRTEKGSGFIRDFTLAELKNYDIGSWFDESFHNERMPTLSEVLDLGRGKIRFEIELKHPTRSFLEKVLSEIRAFDVTADVEITSPHLPLLHHVEGVRKGYFFQPYPEWKGIRLGQKHIIAWMQLIDAQVAHLPYSIINPEFIDLLHAHGFMVHIADLDLNGEVESTILREIDQFSTDKLTQALAVRDRIFGKPNGSKYT
jgi:glycerophosphoryl diester phosphodiesterase